MRILLSVCKIRLHFADSGCKLQVPLTVADFVTAEIPEKQVLLGVCELYKLFRILQFFSVFHILSVLQGFWAKHWYSHLFVKKNFVLWFKTYIKETLCENSTYKIHQIGTIFWQKTVTERQCSCFLFRAWLLFGWLCRLSIHPKFV